MLISSLRYSIYKVQTRFLLRRKLLDYITLKSVCQEHYLSFFELFRVDFSVAAFAGNRVILAPMFPFVKNFFLFSHKSLHLLLDAIRSHEQLAYLTTPFSICQEKMRIFIPDFSNPSGEGFHLCTSGSLTGA